MKKTALLITTFSLLSFSFLKAQAVPAYMNYQGRVTDANGVGLGSGTPVNRTIIFRIYDAATGGNRIWSEQQMVTISEGEFSVLLGNGIQAFYNNANEDPRPALSSIFASGSSRYLEIVVDNGDGTLNTNDAAITPRQQITSTAYSFRAQTADGISGASDLTINPTSIAVTGGSVPGNYGLGWYGTDRPFGGAPIDGPVLFGKSGGALGIADGATKSPVLTWKDNGNVGIGTATPGAKLDVFGVLKVNNNLLDSPQISTLGGDGSRIVLWPGDNTEVPYGFGMEFGALWSSVPSFAGYKWYTGTTQRMVLDNNGSMGLGNNFPRMKLDVNGGIFADNGLAAPPTATTTGGNGARLVLWPGADFADTPFALGIDTATMWSCVPTAAVHKWYVGADAKMLIGSSGMAIPGKTTLEFGFGVANKEVSAGKIGYGTFSSDASLDIVGAGTSNGDRRVQFFAEGGTTFTGPVGIGGAPAKAKFEVIGGGGSYTSVGSPVGINKSNGAVVATFQAGNWGLASIYASSDIIGGGSIISISDARVKNIKGLSDSARDLKTLQSIEITDYNYIDTIGKGSVDHKKVIAQQVEKFFPQAVSRRTDSIPDIYKKASIQDGWIELDTNLKVGERVRVIDDSTDKVCDVKEINEKKKKFRVEFAAANKVVFVYGREVNDFRTVDYDAISMLNVSATQQIKKEKDAEVKALQEQNAELLAKVESQAKRLADLEAKDKARDAKLAAIEKAISGGSAPVTQTVSTRKTTGAK